MASQAQQTADEILAHALASGHTVARAARTAGASESTAYRRLRDPDFQTRVAELRAVLLDTIGGRITAETSEACQALSRLIITGSEGVQIRAAKAVIELALKFNDRDRRAGLLGPVPRSLGTDETPAPLSAADPGQPAATPAPVVTAEAGPRADPPAPPRETGAPTGGVPAPGCNPVIAAEASGQPAGNLSKPVTDCHRPAGRLPDQKRTSCPPIPPPVESVLGKANRAHLNQTNRLSAGLAVALERAGIV